MQAVAAKAGVSYSTVSRVINGNVSPKSETARRVFLAMREIGYKPPPPEQRRGPRASRKSAQPATVAALLLGLTPRSMESMPGGRVIHAAERRLAEKGMNLVLSSCSDMEEIPSLVHQPGVSGLLLFSNGAYPSPLVAESLARLPSVWLFTHEVGWGDHVRPNNELIGQLAAGYFVAHGCMTVAFVNLFHGRSALRRRALHLADAMQQKGGKVRLITDDWEFSESENRMDALVEEFASLSPRPEGIFAATDNQLPLLYAALRHRGIEPGVDVRILGCDNQPYALNMVRPRPDTIDIGAEQMGRRSVDQLLWRMQNSDEADGCTVLVRPRLIVAGDPSPLENFSAGPVAAHA